MALIRLLIICLWLVTAFAMASSTAPPTSGRPRVFMYLTGQHPIIPQDLDMVRHITHVGLAFMRSDVFNEAESPSEWPFWGDVSELREKFAPGTKMIVAIGGWGDTAGFEKVALDNMTRERWVRNVAKMVEDTGADGVDVDWEYPGGNGEDYKLVPNEEKAWQIDAFSKLIKLLREALPRPKIISMAVPGLERDMMAFTPETTRIIGPQVDFLNVMTYDLMNRRDNVTKHHTGMRGSERAVKAYLNIGYTSTQLNLGFACYAKWFRTEACDSSNPIGCKTVLLEDPETGADLGQTGSFSWHDVDLGAVEARILQSWLRAEANWMNDPQDGLSYYYWDPEERLWWTFDLSRQIERKYEDIVRKHRLGGVFAWGLGEDAPKFAFTRAIAATLEEWKEKGLHTGDLVHDEL